MLLNLVKCLFCGKKGQAIGMRKIVGIIIVLFVVITMIFIVMRIGNFKEAFLRILGFE